MSKAAESALVSTSVVTDGAQHLLRRAAASALAAHLTRHVALSRASALSLWRRRACGARQALAGKEGGREAAREAPRQPQADWALMKLVFDALLPRRPSAHLRELAVLCRALTLRRLGAGLDRWRGRVAVPKSPARSPRLSPLERECLGLCVASGMQTEGVEPGQMKLSACSVAVQTEADAAGREAPEEAADASPLEVPMGALELELSPIAVASSPTVPQVTGVEALRSVLGKKKQRRAPKEATTKAQQGSPQEAREGSPEAAAEET